MAVTVAGKNYSQIESCNTTGGTWSLTEEVDAANKKEGSGSLSFTMKANGVNTLILSGLSVDFLSGSAHLRFWFLDSAPGLLADTNAAVEVGVSDGINTGYWNLNAQRYAGGWKNMVIDTGKAVDSGTKPTNMNAITSIIFRITQTAGGKNFDNVWLDNICKSDGLIAYGDDGGSYFDFDDIFNADDGILGHGIIRKISGIYYIIGSLEFGNSAGINGCKFQAKSQVAVFEDRPVNVDLYDIDIVDNGTGTTEFILGAKSGTAGIQGCTVRVESTSQLAKFDLDANADADVDNFKMYASVFYGADSIKFANAAVNVEVLGCSFEKCKQVDPDDAVTKDCFFIDSADVDAALLWNENINITTCNFIANTTGAGIEMPSAVGTPYAYNGHLFSGNTHDVLNSSGSAITINKNNGSNPITSEGSAVTFLASVTITVTVKDESGNIIQNAQTAIYKVSDRSQIMNEDTNASGIATESYSGTTPVEVEVRCRKASTGATKYKNFSSIQTIISNGLDFAITLVEDPNA